MRDSGASEKAGALASGGWACGKCIKRAASGVAYVRIEGNTLVFHASQNDGSPAIMG